MCTKTHHTQTLITTRLIMLRTTDFFFICTEIKPKMKSYKNPDTDSNNTTHTHHFSNSHIIVSPFSSFTQKNIEKFQFQNFLL